MSKDQYHDEGPSRKYWIQLPNMIDDSDLDPYEFRLYVHLKHVAGDEGQCWQSTETLATHCNMSAGKVSQAKQSLTERGLITISHQKSKHGGKPYHIITITDIWVQNMAHYSNRPSPHEVASSPHEVASSPHEIKKNPIRKTLEEAAAAAAEKPNLEHSPPPYQDDWTEEDHENFECILNSWVSEFGKMTARQVEKMIALWNEYPELEIHTYAWNEMIEAKAKRGVRPNLTYYEKCLETERRQNWIVVSDNGGNNDGKTNT